MFDLPYIPPPEQPPATANEVLWYYQTNYQAYIIDQLKERIRNLGEINAILIYELNNKDQECGR